MLHDFALTNKYGDELLLFHIDRFLSKYPSYAKSMADAVIYFSKETAVSASKAQRKYLLHYTVADELVKSLKASRAVRHCHEPVRDEFCIDPEQARLLADYILRKRGSIQ